MAFLVPLIAPIAEGLLSGTAGALAAYGTQKVIGDAEMEAPVEQTQPQLLGVEQMGQQHMQATQQMHTAQGSNPSSTSTAASGSQTNQANQIPLAFNSQQLSQFVPANSPQMGMALAQSANSLGQSVSDGAALLANGQTYLQNQRAISEGILEPQHSGASAKIAHAMSGTSPNQQQYLMPRAVNLSTAAMQGNANPALQNFAPRNDVLVGVQNQVPTPGSDWTMIQRAPQPVFKTINNQTTNIPRLDDIAQNGGMNANSNPTSLSNATKGVGREILSGLTAGASNALGQVAANAGTQALNLASNVVSRGAAKIGSTIQTALGSVIKKIIGDAPPMEHPPVWANEMLNSGLRIDPEIMKIVGDALPIPVGMSTVPVMDGVSKVVGDAPPSSLPNQPGVMTPEQADAAKNNIARSSVFQLTAKLVVQEQLLETARGTVRGLNVISQNRQYARTLTPVSGSFNQAAVRVVNGIQGATLIPGMLYHCALPADPTDNAEWSYQVNLIRPTTGAYPVPPKVAPPIGGNTTLDTLRPLLLGAATTDYSSQLRVNNTTTNIDAMMRAASVASQLIMSQSGYSFVAPLIKMIGYILNRNFLVGEGLTTFLTGQNFAFQAGWVPDDPSYGWIPAPVLFPLSDIIRKDEFPTDPGYRVIQMACVTEKDFILAISGGLGVSAWQKAFLPQNWNANCAIVFIPAGSADNSELNMARVVTQMEYPFCVDFAAGDHAGFYTYARDASGNYVLTTLPIPVGHEQSQIITKSQFTRIAGPRQAVLFVLLGQFQPIAMTMKVGPADHVIGLNTMDNGPNAPFDVPFDPEDDASNFKIWSEYMVSSGFTSAIMTLMQEWEAFYGNNSDRASALRFWADHSRVYGVPPKVVQDVVPGSQQQISGVQTTSPVATPASWNAPRAPDTPAYLQHLPAWSDLPNKEFFFCMSTTASGIPVSWRSYKTKTETMPAYFDGATDCVTVIGQSDYMIDYLILKKWVYPLEEYPANTLADAGRLSLTITVMSNQIAALTDMAYQSCNLNQTALSMPPALREVPVIRLLIERMLYPAVEGMMTMGIQYPSIYTNRITFFANTTLMTIPDTYATIVTQPIATGQLISTPSRIPREVMGQWAPSLQPIWNRLRLNLEAMKPSRANVTINNELLNFFSILICPDDTGLAPIAQSLLNSLISRVSQGVVTLGRSVNQGFVARNTRDQQLRGIAFSFRYFDEFRSQYINSAFGAGDISLPVFSYSGLPKVETIPNRDMVNGFDPLRILSIGPIDAYGPGDGSYGYVMYYNLTGGFSTITTDLHANVPESVFTGSGLEQLLNFL